jgi:hypothetical protein
MSESSFRRGLRGGILACAAAAALAPAQAAVYTGTWDPGYGAPFPSLGWKGTATFFIPDACLSFAASWVPNGDACSGNGMKVLAATLSFYDIVADPSGSGPAAQTFSFVDPATPAVLEMYVGANNQLQGVNTALFAPVFPSTPAALAIAGGGSHFFRLAMLKVGSPLDTPNVTLYHSEAITDAPCSVGGDCLVGESAERAFLKITPVVTPAIPEPGTYALMAAGLLAVAAATARRRRR